MDSDEYIVGTRRKVGRIPSLAELRACREVTGNGMSRNEMATEVVALDIDKRRNGGDPGLIAVRLRALADFIVEHYDELPDDSRLSFRRDSNSSVWLGSSTPLEGE